MMGFRIIVDRDFPPTTEVLVRVDGEALAKAIRQSLEASLTRINETLIQIWKEASCLPSPSPLDN